MTSFDDDKSTTQIEKLTEKNYRSWYTTVRAVLREKKLFDVVDGTTPKPTTPSKEGKTDEEYDSAMATYKEDLATWEQRALASCRILLSAITGRLITYVEEEDDPARIWQILKDKFRPTTDITLAQSLKNLISLRMAEDGNMESHIRDFLGAKRRVEEHSVQLVDVVYKTIFLLSMPTAYQMTVTAIEGQPDVSLEAAMNRLLDEYRKRRNSGGEMVMSALLTKQGHKAGFRGKSHAKAKLKCTHCERTGHVEATCWAKYPELKSKANKAASQPNLAFSVSKAIVHEARIDGNKDDETGGSPSHWILDSGATEHFTPHRHLYNTYEQLEKPVDVITAKRKLHGIGIGAIEVTLEGAGGKHVTVTLENVLHVPGMDSNLLSSNVLLKRGFEISMYPMKGTNILYDSEIIAKTVPYDGLSRLKTVDIDETAVYKARGEEPKEKSTPKLPYDVWHRRFAHLGPWNLIKVEKMVDGMRIDEATLPKDELCEACIKGSQTRDLNDKPMRRRTVPGDLIHSDLCGPITPLSTGENLYFVTFIDDATRMT